MKTLLSTILLLIFNCFVFGQDINATTEDGKRVTLKPNGTWTYVAPLQTDQAQSKPENVESSKSRRNLTSDDPIAIGKFFPTIEKEISKSEFETEAQYGKRILDFLKNTKFKGKPLDQVVFVDDLHPIYDAESGRFVATVSSIKVSSGTTESFVILTKQQYGVYRKYEDLFGFDMPSKEAEKVRSNLRVAIYGFPVRFEDYKNRLYIAPLKIEVFNNETGEIYYTKSYRI
jgi:hypothetical protein